MKEFSIASKLMGSDFKLGIVMSDQKKAEDLLQIGIAEIQRLEKLLSTFLPNSEVTQINQGAAVKPVVVSKECFELVQRSIRISQLTNGSFDISTSPLKQLYQFDAKSFAMPSEQRIRKTLKAVGYQNIVLNPKAQSVQFLHKGTCISFAAIGKGYAADKVKQLWKAEGVSSGYINASGDLTAFGSSPDQAPWKIGIANPDTKTKTLMYIPLQNAAVATSGDYEQYFMQQGIRYSHNINPHTGLPLTGIKSVTVSSPSAELSDALATGVYVKGVKEGIAFVNQLPQTEAIIINDKNELFFSKDINYETIEL